MRCKKCQKSFPNWLLYRGRRRNLSNRKYCFDCSPFDKHNTIQLHIDAPHKGEKIKCKKCGKTYTYLRRGETKSLCLTCTGRTHANRKKIWAVKYLGGKCKVCGYSKCLRALMFHHKDPSTKKFTISSWYCLSYERLKKELDKCILLCANHHYELHAGIIDL